MKRIKIFAMAAIASITVAAPALADFVRLGSVDIGFRADRTSKWTRFGGSMEGLRLEADGSDIKCRSIVAHFGDGSQQNVFSGQLFEKQPVVVDVRGGTRRVNDVTFTCRSDERSGGKVYIAADIGRYRDEWRRSPDWALVWSRVFNWMPTGNNGYDPNYWVPLGRRTFQGRNDVDSTFTGWNGRSVDKVGFKALNDDARCSRIRVNFGDGSSKTLDVGRLDQGRFRSFDLPGNKRNINSIDMRCRGLNRFNVMIEISARK